jgi:hypothetical protein
MQSLDLVRDNLEKSRDRVLARVGDMAAHALVFPTPHGGGNTIWVLGHLAYIEALITHSFMRGKANPLADWEPVFDGSEVSGRADDYPPFDEVLAECRRRREDTLGFVTELAEVDLDRPSVACPEGFEDTFGTWRLCLQFCADHWYMHRGQLADARRAARLERMWL